MLYSRYFLRSVFILLQFISFLLGNAQTINILSWNIQDFSCTKDDSEILAIAKIVKDADLIAIQEVVGKDPRGAQVVARLTDQLNRMGSKWESSISDPTNSPKKGQSEKYTFIWKTSVISKVGRHFLDSILDIPCIREPFISRFKTRKEGKEFIVVNFHSRKYDQHPEQEVKYFTHYPRRFEVPVIIVGDFNLSEDHAVFSKLYNQGYIPAVINQKTTLKQLCKDGLYLNYAIDNIYIPETVCFHHGQSINFVNNCEGLAAARMISDHLPVQCRLSF